MSAGRMTWRRAGVMAVWLTGLCVLIALSASVASAARAKPRQVSVVRGHHLGARIFPDDAFTVRDRAQATRRRVNFRRGVDYPTVRGRVRRGCTRADY